MFIIWRIFLASRKLVGFVESYVILVYPFWPHCLSWKNLRRNYILVESDNIFRFQNKKFYDEEYSTMVEPRTAVEMVVAVDKVFHHIWKRGYFVSGHKSITYFDSFYTAPTTKKDTEAHAI